jgi:hypothetical protein
MDMWHALHKVPHEVFSQRVLFVYIAYAGSCAGSAAVSLLQLLAPEAARFAVLWLGFASGRVVLASASAASLYIARQAGLSAPCFPASWGIAPRLGVLLRPLFPGVGLIVPALSDLQAQTAFWALAQIWFSYHNGGRAQE